MSGHDTHNEETEKKSILSQMFDESIAGGAMFYSILAVVLMILILTGVIPMLY
ncbi:hypothetical protein [Salibacter halophilus]|uniref:hypothetical protein n=1 Tax=Salibacter halophilus TaxID=1803916 RepID=UPI0014788A4B|nr:hypothetical protein [Salibacter halophilus]